MSHLNSLGSEAVARGLITCGVDDLLGNRKKWTKAVIQHSPAVAGTDQCSLIQDTGSHESVAMLGESICSISTAARSLGNI